MRRSAFTLIELLIVIAIFAIMAAILFPVFARARENARRASCQSNLKQIGLGLTQYLQDFDENMPFSFYGAPVDSENGNYKWMDAIQPYVRAEQIFDCPSDTLSPKYQVRKGQNFGSYAQNGAYSLTSDTQTPPRSRAGQIVNIARIGSPAATVWATDSNNGNDMTWGGSSGGSYGFTWPDANSNPSIQTFGGLRQLNQMHERHLELLNVLWCDGHVKAMKLDALARTRDVETGNPSLGVKPVMYQFTIEDD